MKKISFVFLSFLLFTVIITPLTVYGQEENMTQDLQQMKDEMETQRETLRENIKKEAADFRQKMQTETETLRKEMQDKRQELYEKIQTELKDKLQSSGKTIVKGTVQSVTDTTVIITSSDSATITVTIDDKTKIVRRFGGKSTVTEITTGDDVQVLGTYSNDEKTTVEAIVIRDKSIQKRYGVVLGTVTSVTGNIITIDPINKPETTVTVTSSSKLVNRKEETIGLTDIQIGHRIRVKGMWDRAVNTVTEVTQIKDFSIPVTALPSGTVTPIP